MASSPPPPSPNGRGPAPWFNYASASSVGIEMVVVFSMFALGGYWLERNVTHWSPWTMMIGLAFGIFASSMVIVRLIREHNQAMAAKAEAQAASGQMPDAERPAGEEGDHLPTAGPRAGEPPNEAPRGPASPASATTSGPITPHESSAPRRVTTSTTNAADEVEAVEVELAQALDNDELPPPLRALFRADLPNRASRPPPRDDSEGT